MGSPSKDLILVEDTLRLLIERLIDAQEGLQKIGEDLQNELLKRHFLAESLKRAQFRGDLESILHQEGERDLNIRGTAEGVAIRAWAEFKHALGGGDRTLLATAEDAENALVEMYGSAREKDLPLPVRQTLTSQAAHVQQSLEMIRAAREALR